MIHSAKSSVMDDPGKIKDGLRLFEDEIACYMRSFGDEYLYKERVVPINRFSYGRVTKVRSH